MKNFEFFDHTGDEGVTVFGASNKDLFCNAAEAFFTVISDPTMVRPLLSQRIIVDADDYEELLVTWLNELLFVFETESLLFCRYDIQELDRRNVTALAWGERYDAGRHPIKRVIKAVTYHQLTVVEHNGRWEARVVFDL